MTIPKMVDIQLPLLRLLGDGEERRVAEMVGLLANRFGLTEDDRAETINTGEPRFKNRVWWASVELRQKGLIDRPQRGMIRITSQGRQVLATEPSKGDVPRLVTERLIQDTPAPSEETPDEQLEASYRTLQEQLAQDLLDRLKNASPAFFEQVVVDVLVAMGYGGSRRDAGKAVGRTGDDGLDGVINEDRLGLDVIYLQAKRWQNPVRRPDIQAFVGSLEGQRARKGVFITTSRFTPDAQEYVRRIEKKVVLIDGEELAQLMIEHGVGVTAVVTYTVKRIDTDYFDDGAG